MLRGARKRVFAGFRRRAAGAEGRSPSAHRRSDCRWPRRARRSRWFGVSCCGRDPRPAACGRRRHRRVPWQPRSGWRPYRGVRAAPPLRGITPGCVPCTASPPSHRRPTRQPICRRPRWLPPHRLPWRAARSRRASNRRRALRTPNFRRGRSHNRGRSQERRRALRRCPARYPASRCGGTQVSLPHRAPRRSPPPMPRAASAMGSLPPRRDCRSHRHLVVLLPWRSERGSRLLE